MKENINALDEISKGASMGKDAIHFLLDKVEDDNFEKVLNQQYKDYENISLKIKDIYSKYNDDDKPHETNVMNKVMTWYGIEMKTLTDKSNSKIAELVLQGTNMGIIEGRKILNKKQINEDVRKIISEYVIMQENAVEKLKYFL